MFNVLLEKIIFLIVNGSVVLYINNEYFVGLKLFWFVSFLDESWLWFFVDNGWNIW